MASVGQRHLHAILLHGRADGRDVIATFQQVVGELLAERMSKLVTTHGAPRLCLSGGCALNIRWNPAMRSTAAADIRVRHCANDRDLALGAAGAGAAPLGI